MDIKEIQNLIKFVQKSGVEEVKIERENFKITIRTKPDSKQNITVEDVPASFSPKPTKTITEASLDPITTSLIEECFAVKSAITKTKKKNIH